MNRVPSAVLVKTGTRKTLWENFHETCIALKGSHEHVMKFFADELATKCSLDHLNRLEIRCKVNEGQIHSLIRKYFLELDSRGDEKETPVERRSKLYVAAEEIMNRLDADIPRAELETNIRNILGRFQTWAYSEGFNAAAIHHSHPETVIES